MALTLLLNAITIVLGSGAACTIAAFRLSSSAPLRLVGRLYVDIFRSLPLLVLIVWIFFALPLLPYAGVQLAPFWAAVLALSLNLAAFGAEIIRAGILTVPREHEETARVAGVTAFRIWWHIKLPVAIRTMLPPLFGLYINQFKLSVLASIIAVPELYHVASTIASESFRPLEAYSILAILCLLLLLPTAAIQSRLENQFSGREGVAGPVPSADTDVLTPAAEFPISHASERTALTGKHITYIAPNGTTILADVSLNAQSGHVTAIVGSNGSGKSTLLRALAGVLPIVGTRELLGQHGKAVRLAYMPQRNVVLEHLTVEQNVRQWAQLSNETHDNSAEFWLAKLGLHTLRTASPRRLSGGELQRVALARALCTNPNVLLLDEPTAAMDFAWCVQIHGLIRALADAGRTVVVVTHSISFLRDVADDVLFIRHGTIVEAGPAAATLAQPRTMDFRLFLEAA